MLRLLIIAAGLYVVYKLFFSGKKKDKKSYNLENSEHKTVGDMVKDPVCGTYVSVNSDIRVREGDKVYFFCSYECRDKFLKSRGYEKHD